MRPPALSKAVQKKTAPVGERAAVAADFKRQPPAPPPGEDLHGARRKADAGSGLAAGRTVELLL